MIKIESPLAKSLHKMLRAEFWPNRDPLTELGFETLRLSKPKTFFASKKRLFLNPDYPINPYVVVHNDTINEYDVFGLIAFAPGHGPGDIPGRTYPFGYTCFFPNPTLPLPDRDLVWGWIGQTTQSPTQPITPCQQACIDKAKKKMQEGCMTGDMALFKSGCNDFGNCYTPYDTN